MTQVASPLAYSPQLVIGQVFGLDPAELFDKEAQGQIQLNSALLHLQIYQRADANALVLLADLGLLPNENKLAIYQLLLAANSGWRDLAGGALCTNDSGERAFLRLRLDLNTLSVEALNQWLTAFVVAAENWAERLAAPALPIAMLDVAPASQPLSFPGTRPFDLA